MKYSSYIVCNEHIAQVSDFLEQFFEKLTTEYNFEGWLTFKIGNTTFTLNLMSDRDLPLTQNMTLELYCDSLDELKNLAEKHGVKTQSIEGTKALQHYTYHFAEIKGPHNICNVELSYTVNNNN